MQDGILQTNTILVSIDRYVLRCAHKVSTYIVLLTNEAEHYHVPMQYQLYIDTNRAWTITF